MNIIATATVANHITFKGDNTFLMLFLKNDYYTGTLSCIVTTLVQNSLRVKQLFVIFAKDLVFLTKLHWKNKSLISLTYRWILVQSKPLAPSHACFHFRQYVTCVKHRLTCTSFLVENVNNAGSVSYFFSQNTDKFSCHEDIAYTLIFLSSKA